MRIVVVGAGYVGLVTGTCLAETGNHVVCVDKDPRKIDMLGKGKVPFYEAGLAELIERNVRAGRLVFTHTARTAGTLADSTAGGIPWEVYIVSAHTGVPTLWFLSETDSAYSVDNMPPSPPLALSAEQSHAPEGLQLDWDDNSEGDLAYYAVYRGTDEHFVPGTGSRLATPVSPEYFDDEWRWDSGYYYKVSAVDRHGNESGFAMIAPGSVTGDDPAPLPDATFLAQNFPNPFNPNTTIAFGVRSGGSVNLSVYDAAGRLITVLIDETRPAGRYTAAWNGEDQGGTPVASGVYFYRLVAGEFTRTRKMVLLR